MIMRLIKILIKYVFKGIVVITGEVKSFRHQCCQLQVALRVVVIQLKVLFALTNLSVMKWITKRE